MLRNDEVFALNAVVNHLGGPPKVVGTEGENPPDAYVALHGTRVPLEITTLSQFCIENGNKKNRRTQDTFGLQFADELDRALGDKVPASSTVLMFLEMPVKEPKKFKIAVLKWLDNEIPRLTDQFIDVKILDAKVSAKLIRGYQDRKRIVAAVSNSNSSADVALNVRMMLEDRILEKERVFQKMKYEGERWLALINDYFIADSRSYSRSLRKDPLDHGFQRLFLISLKGEVSELSCETS